MKHRELIARLIVAASVILTPAAIKQAYATRGYWAVGGEWFLIPLGLLIAQFWKDVASTMTEEMDKKRGPYLRATGQGPNTNLPRSSVSHGALDHKRRRRGEVTQTQTSQFQGDKIP